MQLATSTPSLSTPSQGGRGIRGRGPNGRGAVVEEQVQLGKDSPSFML